MSASIFVITDPWRVLRFAAQVLLRQLVCIQMFSTWIQQEQLALQACEQYDTYGTIWPFLLPVYTNLYNVCKTLLQSYYLGVYVHMHIHVHHEVERNVYVLYMRVVLKSLTRKQTSDPKKYFAKLERTPCLTGGFRKNSKIDLGSKTRSFK